MNNSFFEKTMKVVRKHRGIKLFATERRRNYLVLEPNYFITNFFTENLLATEMTKTEVLMNKPVCLGLLILELSKILRYESWYDYVKPKYGKKTKLCFMGSDIYWISYVKTDAIYKDIANDVETRLDTSNSEIDRPLTKGKNKKVTGLMKDELGGQIMK